MSCSRRGNGINFCGGSLSSKESIKVILFHADWCGHCKTLINSGNWQKIQNLASDLPITFHKFEEKTEEAQMASQGVIKINGVEIGKLEGGINGWPTIVIINDGKVSTYSGPREPSIIVEHLKGLVNGIKGGSTVISQNKYAKMPAQCGGSSGSKNNDFNNDYYKLKYLKYKAKYLATKNK